MDIPLHLMTGKDSARLIIAWPSIQAFPPASNLGGKREMRLHPSHRSKPSNQDIRTWVKADHKHYWEAWKRDELTQFPRIGVRIGPLRENGAFDSPEFIANPLRVERERDKIDWDGLYTRARCDAEVATLEHGRALLRENFILGQRKEGPYMDGLLYIRADNLFLAEIQRCKNKLRLTSAILSQRKAAKAKLQAKKETWMAIGSDDATALRFKQAGYTIRKIETSAKRYYEMKMENQ